MRGRRPNQAPGLAAGIPIANGLSRGASLVVDLVGGESVGGVGCMRVEVLSEHPADMVTDAEGVRRRSVETQLDVVEKLRAERRRVLSEGRVLTWVRMGSAVREAKRSAVRVQISSALPKQGEQAARAGRNAERRVAGQLGAVLDDSWILFRGYLTARGELDKLLVGPRGVFAIEEKYWSVRVWVSGDSWTAQRVSRRGRAYGSRFPFQDGGGRSPARQVSEPASAVAEVLRRNGQAVRVRPVVLLSHPSARVVSLERPTARVERSVPRLVTFLNDSGSPLDASRAAEVELLVRRDHAANAGKKSPHPTGAPGPSGAPGTASAPAPTSAGGRAEPGRRGPWRPRRRAGRRPGPGTR